MNMLILDDLKESGSLVYGPGAKDDAGGKKINIQHKKNITRSAWTA